MNKHIIILIISLIIGEVMWTVVRPMTHTAKGKVKIIMFGRSTMSLWFKHWNWPYPLRIKTTYKPWPIPYRKYSHGKLFLEYFPMDEPKSKMTNVSFGDTMLRSIDEGLNSGTYDVAFFKFCFVDFRIKENNKDIRFDQLRNIIRNVHKKTSMRNMKLIIGNALPLPEPNEATLDLQLSYNKWLKGFALENNNIMIFDLFGPLTDDSGRFKMDLAHAKGDHHPGEKAFSILDGAFFDMAESWCCEGRDLRGGPHGLDSERAALSEISGVE